MKISHTLTLPLKTQSYNKKPCELKALRIYIGRPNSALSKMHCKSIILSVDPIFFHGTVVRENHSKDPQRTGTNQGIDIIYRTVLSAGCNYLRQYEVGITGGFFHMSLANAIVTGAFQWIS